MMVATPQQAVAQPVSGQVPKQALPPQVVFLRHEGQQLALVLGLQWRVILGRDLVRQARQKARELGASHWVHAGGRAESVGLLLGVRASTKASSDWPRVSYAAAQVFARQAGEGSHVLALPLPDNEHVYWLALVRDGQVVAGGDLCVSRQQLVAVWQAWQARYGESWQVWGQIPAELLTEEPKALLWEQLAKAVSAESLLQVRHQQWRTWPLLWGGVAVIGMSLVYWQPWQGQRPETMAPHLVQDAELTHLAQQSWQTALENWRASTQLPTPIGLEQLAQALLLVPVKTAGWHLERLACRQQLADAWSCTAQYQRQHPLARQRGLRQALPQTWRLHWLDLEQARAEWSVMVPSLPLQWEALPASNDTWLPDADTWLALQSLWQRIEWGQRETVVVQPVLPPGSSTLTAPPAHLPVVAKRQLIVSGPLRSLALLAPQFAARTQWETLELRLGAGHVREELRDSALELTLQGVVYENVSS